jgi:hypothetical protein
LSYYHGRKKVRYRHTRNIFALIGILFLGILAIMVAYLIVMIILAYIGVI